MVKDRKFTNVTGTEFGKLGSVGAFFKQDLRYSLSVAVGYVYS